MRRVLRVFIAVLWLLTPLTRAESEYEVKAAYLVNFAKLVEWPASAFAGKGTLTIGIVGRGTVGDDLARTISGATVNGRAIETRRVSAGDGGGLVACHVLFVLESERAEAVLAAVLGRPVLVVGEAEDFARRGGAIGFVKDGGTVKFEANPKAAVRNGITVSAKLLRVARGIIDR
jgi:YfiR/HmsC-like